MSKFTEEEKSRMIKEWQATGKNMSKWCVEHRIPKSTFYTWVNRGSKKQKILDIKKFIESPLKPQVLSEINIVVKGISISIIQTDA